MNAKHSVKLGDAGFAIGYAVGIAEIIYEFHGAKMVVTSLDDSTHSKNSLHYKGLAVDLRTNNLSADQRGRIFQSLKEKLEPLGYDCIDEGDHFHVEHDPKGAETFIKRVD